MAITHSKLQCMNRLRASAFGATAAASGVTARGDAATGGGVAGKVCGVTRPADAVPTTLRGAIAVESDVLGVST